MSDSREKLTVYNIKSSDVMLSQSLKILWAHWNITRTNKISKGLLCFEKKLRNFKIEAQWIELYLKKSLRSIYRDRLQLLFSRYGGKNCL